jgi:hypothetical protein
MGADPHTSVVSRHLQYWDAQNLFVIGRLGLPLQGRIQSDGTSGRNGAQAVWEMLRKLEEIGAVEIEWGSQGRGHTNKYRLHQMPARTGAAP